VDGRRQTAGGGWARGTRGRCRAVGSCERLVWKEQGGEAGRPARPAHPHQHEQRAERPAAEMKRRREGQAQYYVASAMGSIEETPGLGGPWADACPAAAVGEWFWWPWWLSFNFAPVSVCALFERRQTATRTCLTAPGMHSRRDGSPAQSDLSDLVGVVGTVRSA